MQNGDLAESRPDRLLVVLEGVLALVVQEKEYTRWTHRERVVTNHIQWRDVPLRRLIVMMANPTYEVEVVTFLSEKLAEQATEFLATIDTPEPTVRYTPIEEFVATLPYQPRIRAIYDSDPENLDRFGQVGVAVVAGNDF